MTDSSPVDQAISCVESASDVRLYFAAPPQATLMPFAKDKTKRFLVVVLFLIEQALNFETLTFICTRVIQLLDEQEVLSNLGGIEIMPCVVRENVTKRVLRLSVLSHAVEKAKDLSTEEIKIAKPADGITSYFYLKDIKL